MNTINVIVELGPESMAKLDKILAAIQAGQILTIDGKRLVGETYDQMDSTLGQRRMLVERGAV